MLFSGLDTTSNRALELAKSKDRVLDSSKNHRELNSLEYSFSMLFSYRQVKQEIIMSGLGQIRSLHLPEGGCVPGRGLGAWGTGLNDVSSGSILTLLLGCDFEQVTKHFESKFLHLKREVIMVYSYRVVGIVT